MSVETVAYWQFFWGGLFDAKPSDGAIHLIRHVGTRTPGPTLCGIDRFSPLSPGGGWSTDRRGSISYGKDWPVCSPCMLALEGAA